MIIYKLTSPSGKVYIGQTRMNLKRRLSRHKTASKTGRKSKIFNALRKYPLDLWTKEILFETDNLNELNQKEIEYISKFDSFKIGYNSTLGGEGTIGIVRSKEIKLKMGKNNLGNKYCLGRIVSEETRLKISNSKIGIKQSIETINKKIGIKLSSESIAKRQQTRKENGHGMGRPKKAVIL